MACEWFEIPGAGDGAVAVVCSRGQRRKRCAFCGQQTGVKLCDFPHRGKKRGSTCDKALCARCATEVIPNRDLCPAHAQLVRDAKVPAELLACSDEHALEVVADFCLDRGLAGPELTKAKVNAPAVVPPPAIAPVGFSARDRDEWLEYYNERAAIAEYLGGAERAAAEFLARELAGPPPRQNNHGPLFGARYG